MKIYLIPGLGYDCRIFKKLALEGHEVSCLNWIEPYRQEAIGDYALRLFCDVPEDEEVVLMGHSLGGIIAQEVAARRKIRLVVLISSVRSRLEIPFFFKAIKPLGLYRLFTKELSIRTVKYWGANHGFISPADQDLFKSMVGKHSNAYLQWALKALSGWVHPAIPPTTSVFQVHGTNDRTFPVQLIERADVIMESGTHVMVYAEAAKVEKAVLAWLVQQ